MEAERATKILLAEHDAAARARLADGLRALGHGVSEAQDVASCLQVLRDEEPQLVLLDSALSDEDPIALCRRLREGSGARPPLVMMIEADEAIGLEQVIRAGVTDFLQRPVHTELLEHVVRRTLARGTRVPTVFPVRSTSGTTDDLIDFLAAHIPLAARASKHIAVLHIDLTDEAFGGEWDSLDEKASAELLAFLDDCFRGVYKHQTARETLLAPRAGICSVRTSASSFAIAIPEMDRVQDAVKVASRIHERLSRKVVVAGRKTVVTASIGIASYPEDGSDPKGLLDCATIASSRSALDGRNSLEYFTESMSRWVFERLTLESSLRDALGNDELSVHYQPRVDINSRKIVGMEALVRWTHPQLGMISPAQFIPLAEETGLVGPIDEWVLNEACRQNRKWRDMGLPPIRVSVRRRPS